MPKAIKVSIIIPAYNEADTIQKCLDAIAQQTVMPHEVIVVDNNSTDTTAMLARRYAFARVISETKQGVVHARTTGFNAATGDIIGRIDADTRIGPDWVETLGKTMVDRGVDAVSGGVIFDAISFPAVWDLFEAVARRYFALTMRREYTLHGANMAMTRKAWLATKDSLCARAGLHEDFDIAIHMHAAGFRAAYAPELKAHATLRQAGNRFPEYAKYVLSYAESYRQHGRTRAAWLYVSAINAMLAYPLIHAAYLGYDEHKDGFSLVRLFGRHKPSRVNPTSFID